MNVSDKIREDAGPEDFGIPAEYAERTRFYADWLTFRPAIAPPVAAGIVDTPELHRLLNHWSGAELGKRTINAYQALITHIDAWGAQNLEAVTYKLSTAQHKVFRLEGELRESEHFKDQYLQRAEKAEARIAELEDELENQKEFFGNYIIELGEQD